MEKEGPAESRPGDANPLARAARGKGRVVIIHHWDADGIASAAMVAQEVLGTSPPAVVRNQSPAIGRWRLSPEEVTGLAAWGPDLLVLVDLAVLDDDLDAILDGLPGVPGVMVDHHRAERPEHPRLEYHNPVAEGAPEDENPSCTWVLMHLLGRPMDLLSVLGVFGDRGRGVVEEPVWDDLRAYLDGAGLDPMDMHRLVDLVDSSAKRKDVAGVNAAVGQLQAAWDDLQGLLGVPEWVVAATEVEQELSEQLERGPETVVGRTLVKTIDTPYLVISTAARRLVRSREQEVVLVVNVGYSPEEAQLYLRRRDGLDLSPLIGDLRGQGLSAGGKSEVLGAIAPKARLDSVVGEVLRFLCAKGYARMGDV